MIMLTAEQIIRKYYPEDNELRRLLVHHSRQVAHKAIEVAHRHPELHLDENLLQRAAMLHDLGIFLTDAPGIHCHGDQPYLLHGYLGAQIMRKEKDEAVARICERHTGTGLTEEDITRQGLPLPPGIYVPETLEEKVVCYADKFFSKAHPERERTPEEVVRSLEKWGTRCVETFRGWHGLFA